MAERATLTQGVQLGVESTPGTGVSADKKLTSTSIEIKTKADIKNFRPMGTKYSTTEVLGKEWTEFSITGMGSYNDTSYLLSSCLAYATPAQVGVTTAYLWTFAPSSSATDTVKTYTIEQGDATRAHKIAYGTISEIEYTFTRDSVDVKGTGIGQKLDDGITLTATPTSIAEKPILPTDVDIYLDSTSAGLGTTKLTRAVKCTVQVSDRFGPVWVLNSANSAFVSTVETEPKAEIKLLVEADTSGMAILTSMRDSSTQFMRIQATSADDAGASTPYQLSWDAAVKVKDVGDFSDEEGIYAIEWTFDQVHDTTWGKAFTVNCTNTLTDL
jgi:hypothetical protein